MTELVTEALNHTLYDDRMLLVKNQALIVHSLWITTCAWAMYELRPYAIVIPSKIIYRICLKIVQRRIYSLKTSRYLKNVEKKELARQRGHLSAHCTENDTGVKSMKSLFVTCTERGSALFWYKHAINLSAKLYLINLKIYVHFHHLYRVHSPSQWLRAT